MNPWAVGLSKFEEIFYLDSSGLKPWAHPSLLTARSGQSCLAWRGSPRVGITPGEEEDTQKWLRKEISPILSAGLGPILWCVLLVQKQSSLLSLIPPQLSHHSMTSLNASSWKTEIAATIA